MYLLKLDENDVVIERKELSNITSLPLNTKLSEEWMIVGIPVNVGQIWHQETTSFSDAPRNRWITKLAFDSRFAMAEAVALKMAQTMPNQPNSGESQEDFAARCLQAAQLQVLQQRLNMATYIDLNRQDTRMGVMYLESVGLIAQGRSLEILDNPIEEHEYYKGYGTA